MIYPNYTIEEWLQHHPELASAILEWPLDHEVDCSGGDVIRPYITKEFVGINRVCKCNASMGIPRTTKASQNWSFIFG